MTTEYVNKMLEDGRVDELLLSMKGCFRNEISQVKIVKEDANNKEDELVYLVFIDKSDRFVKRYLLSDFSCERDKYTKSDSDKETQVAVKDVVVENNYISFLKDRYLMYKDKYLNQLEERKNMLNLF